VQRAQAPHRPLTLHQYRLTQPQYPSAITDDGTWNTTGPDAWTSGFFPGVLWQLYNLTGKPEWREHAEDWNEKLANRQRDWSLQHDFGFVYLPSFGEEYAATQSEKARLQVLAAAEATAWAFNPATNSSRTFEGWDPVGSTGGFRQLVIIDHMMNIEILLEGTRLGGPRSYIDKSNSSWVDMAVAHAKAVAKNHIRTDGSTYHVVEYNPVRGTVNKKYTYQGHTHESTWSRGQAWAMAGFVKMYAATKRPEFLHIAEQLSDKWLGMLAAQTGPNGIRGGWVPKWDFNAPYESKLDGPMDSSAAAVAAMAFLQLSELQGANTTCSRRFLCAGINTLRYLSNSQYLARAGGKGGALLQHGTLNKPHGRDIDTGLIFGDYYLLKALQICRRIPGCVGAL